jgi:hypothetical protein
MGLGHADTRPREKLSDQAWPSCAADDRFVVTWKKDWPSDNDFQAIVQAAVLRMVAEQAAVHPARIRRDCPGADARDVSRAIQLLVEGGYIVVPVPPATPSSAIAPVELTERGRARLGGPD